MCQEVIEVDKLPTEQSNQNHVEWSLNQDVQLIYDDDTSNSVAVSDWETVRDYYNE